MLINNRFEIEKKLGSGGFGIVYRAFDKQNDNKLVVIKVLIDTSDTKASSVQWREKHFFKEAKALKTIDHPGVVQFIDVGHTADGQSFFAMEYIEGVDLRSQIDPSRGLTGDYQRAATIIGQLGEALSAAHEKGIYHRDLKPENIMLKKGSVFDEEQVKVIDFGISTVKDSLDEKTEETKVLAGSLKYMAPEQLENKPCAASDLYALGIIAYEIVTGRVPFNPEGNSYIMRVIELMNMQRKGVRVKPRDLRPSVSLLAQNIILKALSFDIKDRYKSAKEFGSLLANALNDLSEKSANYYKDQNTVILQEHTLIGENHPVLTIKDELSNRMPKPANFVDVTKSNVLSDVETSEQEKKLTFKHTIEPQTTLEKGFFLDHYKIISPLGKEETGQVYLANDTKLARKVALKLLPIMPDSDKRTLDRSILEAKTASALNHPNIITLHDINVSHSNPFIVMEFIDGCTLREKIKERISIKSISDIAIQVTKALDIAHERGIVHRAIKPDNIMLHNDGQVKVLNFGLASAINTQPMNDSTFKDPASTFSTTPYMSPEQALGEIVGSATDIFSLGVVLYELSTGQHPFKASSYFDWFNAVTSQQPIVPLQLNAQIPVSFGNLLMKMLEKDLRLRAKAGEVISVLSGQSLALATPTIYSPILPTTLSKYRSVGHKEELKKLNEGMKKAQNGQGSIFSVFGEPGIGKTTLIEGFLTNMEENGEHFYVARGKCSERAAGTEAYLPFIEAIDSLLKKDPRKEVSNRFKSVAPTWYSQMSPDVTTTNLQEQLKLTSQERMKWELTTFFQELSKQKPLILFFDDLHWADTSTIDLLTHLANRVEQVRILILITYRLAELLLSKSPLISVKLDLVTRGLCHEIEVRLLVNKDVEDYIAMEFPENNFPTKFAKLIYEKTEGSPLFMVNLISYLRDRKVIIEANDQWKITNPMTELFNDIPESVKSMIKKKLDHLSEEDRNLLKAASIQGYEFDTEVVSRVIDMDAEDIEERLEHLEKVHKIVSQIDEHEHPDKTFTLRYRFVHVLYQNALYDSVRPTKKTTLSKKVAQTLESHYRKNSSDIAVKLAFLYEVAREFAKATDYYIVATQSATQLFAYKEAAILCGKGLELLPKISEEENVTQKELILHMIIGGVKSALSGWAELEVEEAYLKAQTLCQELKLSDYKYLMPVLWGLWTVYFVRSELKKAYEIVTKIDNLIQGLDDPKVKPLVIHAAGTTLKYMGDYKTALQHLKEGHALYTPQNDKIMTMQAYLSPGVIIAFYSADCLWELGYPDQATKRMAEAMDIAKTLSHPHSLAIAMAKTLGFYQRSHDIEKMKDLVETTSAFCSEHGIYIWLLIADFYKGWVLVQNGAITEGLKKMNEAITIYAATKSRLSLPFFWLVQAKELAKHGDKEQALLLLNKSFTHFNTSEEHDYEPEAYRLRGQVTLMDQEHTSTVVEAAETDFLTAIKIAQQQNAKMFELRAVMSLSRLLYSQGKHKEALDKLTHLFNWFTEGFDTVDLIEAQRLIKEMS